MTIAGLAKPSGTMEWTVGASPEIKTDSVQAAQIYFLVWGKSYEKRDELLIAIDESESSWGSRLDGDFLNML
jgi:hypothetical protein